MNNIERLFNEHFLASEMSEFRASSIPNIRNINYAINVWAQKLDSGRLSKTKEESIKSQFVTSFFGDILGFNYGNANEWMLEEEKRSVIDATKVDCALGYFSKENSKVMAVVEVKGAKENLDKKQNRTTDKRTPIQQAFDYSSKMGGECKWVVVTNIIETRFYRSHDQSKFQRFSLRELLNESKRNELLFLFHKKNFIKKEGKSRTELLYEKQGRYKEIEFKPLHIIDKIYDCLKRFEGFGFVDPEYLASLYPFNILNEQVWHYTISNLFTINEEIYNLLIGVTVDNSQILLSTSLQIEIEEAKVIDAKRKLEYIFKVLNHSLIYQITAIKDYEKFKERNKEVIGFSIRHMFSFKEAEEGISKNIHILQSTKCDCLSCNFRSLDFNRFLGKLKAAVGNEEHNTLEYAYGNYLAASNNFKSAYTIYKAIENETKSKEGKEVIYFLTKQNIKYLYNLIESYYWYADAKEILDDIKTVDLDKVIYDDIEFTIDKEVKNYLVKVKEDVLIYEVV